MSSVLEDIHYMVGEINGKVTLLVDQGKVQDDRAAALEARIRIVESRQHWYAGAAAAISGTAAYFIKGWAGHS